MHSSSPLFSSTRCRFRSAPTRILSFFGIFSTVSSRFSQKASFSSRIHPTCGAYPLMTFHITPSGSIFKPIIVSVTLHNSTAVSTCSFFNMIPKPFFFVSIVPHFISFTYASCFFPFQRVFCTHNMSSILRSIRSATSLPYRSWF